MNSLLIRAEDKNIWEKRAAIVPDDLQLILEETGAEAYIEKSEKRFFTGASYEAAGAKACEGMEQGDVIFGVKEIPEEKILDDKTYIFFSHTIKGQSSGMPLLKKIMAANATLIDYEKITDDKNRRLIYFGRYAGDAGAIDILHLMENTGTTTALIPLSRRAGRPTSTLRWLMPKNIFLNSVKPSKSRDCRKSFSPWSSVYWDTAMSRAVPSRF